jgi:hypothetical protein
MRPRREAYSGLLSSTRGVLVAPRWATAIFGYRPPAARMKGNEAENEEGTEGGQRVDRGTPLDRIGHDPRPSVLGAAQILTDAVSAQRLAAGSGLHFPPSDIRPNLHPEPHTGLFILRYFGHAGMHVRP